MEKFEVGEIVVFIGRDSDREIYTVEVGKIKSINEKRKTAFVNYHAGETAACTNFSDLYHIKNSRYIEKTSLGGGII